MKTELTILLLPLMLLSCSKQKPSAGSQASTKSSVASTVLAPKITLVEGPETIEQNQIKNEALTLFTNKDYAGLEALASKYRASKEQYANGYWKLALVYNGLEPAREASDAVWQARIKQVKDWIKARPASVMPRIALGRLLTSYAWKARSSSYADKVKEEDWKLFFARLKEAQEGLKQAKQLQEKCPVFWSSLQLIALGSQFEKPQYNAIFTQAIQEFPDYEYYYNARATYLLPRWYGAEGEWEKDLAKSADRVGGQGGDVLYAQVIWDMNHYGGSGMAADVFEKDKLAWERVDQGFESILKRFPDSLMAKTERAYLAGLAGDKAKARSYFMETKGNVDLTQWEDRETFDKFLEWTFSP